MQQNVRLNKDFPASQWGLNVLENKIIAALPNIPQSTNSNFHEAGASEKALRSDEAARDGQVTIPWDLQETPALSSEVAGEEEMISIF